MIQIKREQNVKNALLVLNQIPEFDGIFNEDYLSARLSPESIILVAFKNDFPVGCKIAYNRYHDGSLYSWLGGVLPQHRKKGIAQKLQNKMEILAKENGYDSMVFKTRNTFKNMLQFGLKNGFVSVEVEKKQSCSENKIILKKVL